MNNTRNGDYLDPEQARPGIHSIDANTGELLWSNVQSNVCFDADEFCDPGISSPVTSIPGAVFAGHLDGFVRAYASGKRRTIVAVPIPDLRESESTVLLGMAVV